MISSYNLSNGGPKLLSARMFIAALRIPRSGL